VLMSSQAAQLLSNADRHHLYVLYLAQIFVRQIDYLIVCFRLEMLEVSGCTVLSCNVAWHAQAAHTNPQHGSWQTHVAESQDEADSSKGFISVQDAVAHAVAALDGVKAPAVPAAPALQVHCLFRHIQGNNPLPAFPAVSYKPRYRFKHICL